MLKKSFPYLSICILGLLLGVLCFSIVSSWLGSTSSAKLNGSMDDYFKAESLARGVGGILYQDSKETYKQQAEFYKDKMTPSLHSTLFSGFLSPKDKYGIVAVKGATTETGFEFKVDVVIYNGTDSRENVLRLKFDGTKLSSISKYY